MSKSFKPDLIEAEFVLTTPMVMSGHDQTKTELRANGVVSQIAFWWRALEWQNLPTPKSSKTLARREAVIFGSAKTGQGIFQVVKCSLSAENIVRHTKKTPGGLNFDWKNAEPERLDKFKKPLPDPDFKNVGSGVTYLAGQGLKDRVAILPSNNQDPIKLCLRLLIRKAAEKAETISLIYAIIALGSLGGIGARNRRAFGSLNLISLKCTIKERNWNEHQVIKPAKAADGLRKSLVERYISEEVRAKRPSIVRAQGNLPPYSAFSPHTDIRVIDLPNMNATQALNWIGHHYQLFRAYGHNAGNGHRIGGEAALHTLKPSQYLFKDDHDWFRQVDNLQPGTIRRAAFGLPLPFLRTVSLEPVGDLDRRASPLFLHLHRFDANHHAAVLTLLGANFLPDACTQMSARGDTFTLPNNNYADIRAFLAWIVGKAP